MSLERGVLPPGGNSLSPLSDGLIPIHTNAFFEQIHHRGLESSAAVAEYLSRCT